MMMIWRSTTHSLFAQSLQKHQRPSQKLHVPRVGSGAYSYFGTKPKASQPYPIEVLCGSWVLVGVTCSYLSQSLRQCLSLSHINFCIWDFGEDLPTKPEVTTLTTRIVGSDYIHRYLYPQNLSRAASDRGTNRDTPTALRCIVSPFVTVSCI